MEHLRIRTGVAPRAGRTPFTLARGSIRKRKSIQTFWVVRTCSQRATNVDGRIASVRAQESAYHPSRSQEVQELEQIAAEIQTREQNM